MSHRKPRSRELTENLESLENFPDEGEIFQVFDQHRRLDKFEQYNNHQKKNLHDSDSNKIKEIKVICKKD